MKAALTSAILISLLLAAPHVAAHGFLSQFTVNGKLYQGNTPNGPTNPSTIRQINAIDPVKGAGNPDINCGLSAQPASQIASANPGDTISFLWSGGGGQKWPHNTGPLMTYMASCGAQTCDQFDAQTAKWFKINQIGRQDDGTWVQQVYMSGQSVDVKVPTNIAPGNYLIRNEIIALHLGVTLGGAEFYPACSQFTIGGNGDGKPSTDELVSFPGGYSDNDPGIFDPNVFDTNAPYTFPGPPIAQFVNSTAGPASATTGSQTGTTSAPMSTASSAPNNGTSTGHCTLRRSTTVSQNRPRHLSRIMRNLIRSTWH